MLLLADRFLFLHDLTRLLQRIWNICYLFYWWDLLLLSFFLSNQENLYMIHHDLDLLYDVIQKLFKLSWYVYLKDSKSYFMTSSASSLIIISILSLFECITCFSSLSMEEIKLFAIANWILHVPDFLRLFMSLKYGLISLRYYSSDSVLFLTPLLSNLM